MPNAAQSVEKKHYEWVAPGGELSASCELIRVNDIMFAALIQLIVEPDLERRVDLYFVSETGIARPKGPLRDLIRSKARRKGRHREDPAMQAERKITSQARESSLGGNDPRQKSQDTKNASEVAERITSLVVGGPERGILDQFSAFFGKKGRGQYYIHLYLHVFQHTYPHATQGSMNKKEAVLRLAMEEPALLHATMSHCCLGATTLRGEPSSHDQYYHKGEAIRLVNSQIGAIINKQKISDGTITAVTCLTHFEIRSRSQSCIKEHMSGIETLVASRGGLQKISDESEIGKAVSWFIYWTDLCAAIALDEPLKFAPLIEPGESQLKGQPSYNDFARRLQASLVKYTALQDLAEEATDLYWHLHNLRVINQTEAAILVDKGKSEVMFEYKIRVETLERRALALSQTPPPDKISKLGSATLATVLIYKLLGSASLIHILLFLRSSPGSIPLSCILARRIRETLQKPDANIVELTKNFPGMMSWILMMGGLGSLGAASGDVDLEFFSGAFRKWHNGLDMTAESKGKGGGKGIAKLDEGDAGRYPSAGIEEFIWLDDYRGPETVGFWELI